MDEEREVLGAYRPARKVNLPVAFAAWMILIISGTLLAPTLAGGASTMMDIGMMNAKRGRMVVNVERSLRKENGCSEEVQR